MKKVTFKVPAISCNHCVNTIIMELSDLEGVYSVSASSDTKQVDVEFDDPATEAQILKTLSDIHYPATI
jgi:copper chaperone